jgi:hypothetical protein
MGFFDFLKTKPSDEKLTDKLVNFVYDSIQNQQGVRVEDALCIIATIVAERCIEVAGEFSIHTHEYDPGSIIFSEKINEILAGPIAEENWNALPETSVFGRIRRGIKAHFTESAYPSLTGIFENFASTVGEHEWGNLVLSVPEENKPFVLPLQAGYETRKFVDKYIHLETKEKTLQIAVNATARILVQTKTALEAKTALLLVFEIINGMSKTATMTDQKMAEVQSQINN